MRRRRGRAASGCLSGETVVGSAAMKRMGEHEAPEAAPGGLTVCVLASGSKGNAIYLSDGRTALLVDAGLTGKEIERRMAERGLSPQALSGIVVSHEHGDHIKGVGVMSRRYGLPVYMTSGTAEAATDRLGKLTEVHHFVPGTAFSVDRLTLRPFSTSHDASDSTGFTVSADGAKVGIATDLGIATSVVRTHLAGCGVLIIEANHDPRMLIDGPYPWYLKQRVRGRTGHLSNESSRDLLGELVHDRLSHVILAHLSEQNNTPDKALAAVAPAIRSPRTRLTVADQHVCGDLLRVDPVAVEG